MRKWRRQKSYEKPPTHGTVNGYNNWLCRCPECTEAARVAVAAYRATHPRRRR